MDVKDFFNNLYWDKKYCRKKDEWTAFVEINLYVSYNWLSTHTCVIKYSCHLQKCIRCQFLCKCCRFTVVACFEMRKKALRHNNLAIWRVNSHTLLLLSGQIVYVFSDYIIIQNSFPQHIPFMLHTFSITNMSTLLQFLVCMPITHTYEKGQLENPKFCVQTNKCHASHGGVKKPRSWENKRSI